MLINNDELKEIVIKNCTCYYFNDIIRTGDSDLDNILIDEKSYKYIFICNILYKSLADFKPSCIRFDNIHGCIRVYDKNRYLVLFESKKYDSIYNRITYLTSKWYCIYNFS